LNLYRAHSKYLNRTVYIRATSLLAANLRAHEFYKANVGQRGDEQHLYVPDSVELVAGSEDVLTARDVEV